MLLSTEKVLKQLRQVGAEHTSTFIQSPSEEPACDKSVSVQKGYETWGGFSGNRCLLHKRLVYS